MTRPDNVRCETCCDLTDHALALAKSLQDWMDNPPPIVVAPPPNALPAGEDLKAGQAVIIRDGKVWLWREPEEQGRGE